MISSQPPTKKWRSVGPASRELGRPHFVGGSPVQPSAISMVALRYHFCQLAYFDAPTRCAEQSVASVELFPFLMLWYSNASMCWIGSLKQHKATLHAHVRVFLYVAHMHARKWLLALACTCALTIIMFFNLFVHGSACQPPILFCLSDSQSVRLSV